MDEATRTTIRLFPQPSSVDWEVGARVGDIELSLCRNPCPEFVPEDEDPGFFLTVCGRGAEPRSDFGTASTCGRTFLLLRQRDGVLAGKVAGMRAVVFPVGETPESSHTLVFMRKASSLERIEWSEARRWLETNPEGEI